MKIFYDHIYGNTTKYDIIYGLALAEVEPNEEEVALDKGWTPMDAFFYKTDKIYLDNLLDLDECSY